MYKLSSFEEPPLKRYLVKTIFHLIVLSVIIVWSLSPRIGFIWRSPNLDVIVKLSAAWQMMSNNGPILSGKGIMAQN